MSGGMTLYVTIAIVTGALWGLCVGAAITNPPKGKSVAIQERIDYPEVGSVTEAGIGEAIRSGTGTRESRNEEISPC